MRGIIMKISHFPKHKYDFIFSVGNNCIASYHLKASSLQFKSYPFDWLSYMSVKKFYNFYIEDFKNFLVYENLIKNENFPENNLWCDKYLKHQFDHDFQDDKISLFEFEKVKEKYDRRISRFKFSLDKSKKSLMIFSFDEFFCKNQ